MAQLEFTPGDGVQILNSFSRVNRSFSGWEVVCKVNDVKSSWRSLSRGLYYVFSYDIKRRESQKVKDIQPVI